MTSKQARKRGKKSKRPDFTDLTEEEILRMKNAKRAVVVVGLVGWEWGWWTTGGGHLVVVVTVVGLQKGLRKARELWICCYLLQVKHAVG